MPRADGRSRRHDRRRPQSRRAADEYQGVTCFFCHSADEVEGDHNNPLRLAEDLVLRGGIGDPLENGAHSSTYSILHDGNHAASSTLCGPCHDIVTPAGVHIERTFAEWRQSLFGPEAEPEVNVSCGECHMSSEDGVVADFPGVGNRIDGYHPHSWPGVDIAITEWPGIAEQRRLIERSLATTVGSRLCYRPDRHDFELQLTNIGAGHNWPSGSSHDRRAWVELRAMAAGETLFESGVVPADRAVSELDDELLWRIGDTAYKADGTIAHMFWDVARVETATLPPAGHPRQRQSRF